MKKIIIPLFVILIMMSCLFAHADYITEPEDNFYQDHQDEFTFDSYYYQAKEEILVVDRPESGNVIGVIEQGRVLQVWYKYQDEEGNLWGCQPVYDQETGVYFNMENMVIFYSLIDFDMEHHDEFKLIEMNTIQFDKNGWITLWEYPGADRISGTLDASEMKEKTWGNEKTSSYTDENGTQWILLGSRGNRGWMNAKKPVQSQKPVIKPTYLEIDEDFSLNEYRAEQMDAQKRKENERLIAILLCGLSACTGILVIMNRKKRKHHEKMD